MTPDEITAMVDGIRPEPPPGLRERVLAAAARVERRPPWWARTSTWSTAAATLLLGNWLLMSVDQAAAPRPPAPSPVVALPPEEAVEFPPLLVAWLQQPSPPLRGSAPTPLNLPADILQ